MVFELLMHQLLKTGRPNLFYCQFTVLATTDEFDPLGCKQRST